MDSLSRSDIADAIRALLPEIEQLADRVRLVGTASCVLRGVDLPAGDIDIAACERSVVDQLTRRAIEAGALCLYGPSLIPDSRQYFARCSFAGVAVEFSTVEHDESDTGFGKWVTDATWEHFDMVEVEGHQIPMVAAELRLLTEVLRRRSDRWKPLGAHLARAGYDERLFEECLRHLPPDAQAVMRSAVHHGAGRDRA